MFVLFLFILKERESHTYYPHFHTLSLRDALPFSYAPLPCLPRPHRRPQLLQTLLLVEMAGRAKLVPEREARPGTGSRRCVLLSPRCPPSRMPTLKPLRRSHCQQCSLN